MQAVQACIVNNDLLAWFVNNAIRNVELVRKNLRIHFASF